MDGVGRLYPGMGFLNIAILLVIGLSTLMLFRIFFVIYRSSKPLHSRQPGPLSAMIVLGSGGHTAEMLNLLAVLQMERFKPRYYIAAATDNMSLQKACVLENSFLDELNCIWKQVKQGMELMKGISLSLGRNFERSMNLAKVEVVGTSHLMQIYRSHEVGQSYVTSVGTTLIALTHALWLMIKIRPQVILCNGPGTCIPLCVITFLFKVSGIRWSSIFYVESIARVRRLSLSGLLLYKLRMADQLFVQWPN